MTLICAEYVTHDIEDTPFDARSVNDRNATTLFLTEMFRGTHSERNCTLANVYSLKCRYIHNLLEL